MSIIISRAFYLILHFFVQSILLKVPRKNLCLFFCLASLGFLVKCRILICFRQLKFCTNVIGDTFTRYEALTCTLNIVFISMSDRPFCLSPDFFIYNITTMISTVNSQLYRPVDITLFGPYSIFYFFFFWHFIYMYSSTGKVIISYSCSATELIF